MLAIVSKNRCSAAGYKAEHICIRSGLAFKTGPETLYGRPKSGHCILSPLTLSDPGCGCRRMPAASAMGKCVRGALEQRQSLCGAALAVATMCMLAASMFGPNTRSYTPSVCENAIATTKLHASNLSSNIQAMHWFVDMQRLASHHKLATLQQFQTKSYLTPFVLLEL